HRPRQGAGDKSPKLPGPGTVGRGHWAAPQVRGRLWLRNSLDAVKLSDLTEKYYRKSHSGPPRHGSFDTMRATAQSASSTPAGVRAMSEHPDSNGQREGLPPSTATSRSLLERIKANDAAAWDQLVTLYGPLVFHWCRSWDLQDQDTADVCQEVFQAV